MTTISVVVAGMCALLLAGAYIIQRIARRVQDDAAQVLRDAQKLQDDVQGATSKMQGSRPSLVIEDETQDDDVDEMLAEVIELSNKKRRRLARDMARRQKKIERELAD